MMADQHDRRILLIEDDPTLGRAYREFLRDEPYDVEIATSGADGLEAIARLTPAAIVLDILLPDMNGIDILRHVQETQLPSSVVVVTTQGSINVAVEAMKAGVFDFIVKPVNAERLIYTLRNAVAHRHLADELDSLRDDFGREAYFGFIGSSLPMQAIYRIIDSAAPSKATVFITGESGTGKEVCAEAIHRRSPRRDAPFIAVNCVAIPRDLIESEIFGHVKGSFTGAVSDRQGAASRADGGTLFFDEICDMDVNLQAKLLRFVQTGGFQRVGAESIETVDVRFVCATNRDPWEEVIAGRFREDLYYRLHVIPITLPPLRDREADVLAIAEHLLVRFASEEQKPFKRFDEDAAAALSRFPWPGNVRQLQNVVRSVVVLHDADVVTLDMLPAQIAGAAGRSPSGVPGPTPTADVRQPIGAGAGGFRPLREVEMDYIQRVIDACDGNIPKAAAILELSPSTLYRRLKDADGDDARRSHG